MTGAINNTVAAFSSAEFGAEDLTKAPVWKDAVNNELDDLESGLTNSLIDHDRFNLLEVETQALGQTLGQQVGVALGQEAKGVYTEMKQGAQNSSGSTTANNPSSSGNNNANNNPQSANSQNNNSPATYGSSNSDNNAISDALSRHGFFGSSSNNGIGFGAIDPNYNNYNTDGNNDDLLPSYGSGNATPTSKQAPVNTTAMSGGQYVGNNNYSQITNALGGRLPDLIDTIMQNQAVGFGNFTNYFNAPTQISFNDNLMDAAHIGLGLGTIGAGVSQYSNVMNGQWQGLNGKWYDLNWGGNQWTGGRTLATDAYEMFDKTGKAFFIVDAGLSGIQAFDAYQKNDWWSQNGVAKNILDIGMGAIGAFIAAPEALTISTGYFVIDKFVGWNNVGTVVNTAYKVDEEELTEQERNMGFGGNP